jgi:hypothetical protein
MGLGSQGQHWAEVKTLLLGKIWYLQCQFEQYGRVMEAPDSILMSLQYVMISLKLLDLLPVPQVPKA